MRTYFPISHAKNIAAYRSRERRHPRWRTIRRLFGISIDEATFFVGVDTAHTPAALERHAKEYFATLRAYDRLERTNNRLRQERRRRGLSLGEAAFLLADNTTARPIPNRLRAARLRTGLSQADVAQCIGISRSKLSYYERGKREPDASTALALALLYGIPLERLFRRHVRSLHAHVRRRESALAKWRRARDFRRNEIFRGRRSIGGIGGLRQWMRIVPGKDILNVKPQWQPAAKQILLRYL